MSMTHKLEDGSPNPAWTRRDALATKPHPKPPQKSAEPHLIGAQTMHVHVHGSCPEEIARKVMDAIRHQSGRFTNADAIDRLP
jgi:hypothetical protein